MAVTKFEIGHKVRVLPDDGKYCHSQRALVGMVGKIVRTRFLRSEYIHIVYFENGDSESFYQRRLELVSPAKETNTLKEYTLGDIVPLDEAKCFESGRTASQLGLKEGDLVVNVSSDNFPKGAVVKLYEDDDSRNPYFMEKNGHSDCAYLHRFAPLSAFTGKPNKPAKPEVTTSITEYSDGVKVSANAVEFDGKRWGRDELTNTVKRYQEILRRPVAVVPEPKKATKKVVKKPAAKK